jgi:hypothetical protein
VFGAARTLFVTVMRKSEQHITVETGYVLEIVGHFGVDVLTSAADVVDFATIMIDGVGK